MSGPGPSIGTAISAQTPAASSSRHEATPEPPPHPGGGYGLGDEQPKPLTFRPLCASTDLDPSGRFTVSILRLVTDSIAQQLKVLSRHVVLHPPLLRPFSDNLGITFPIPPVVMIFAAIAVYVFKLSWDSAEKSGGSWHEVVLRTLIYIAIGTFVYLGVVERIVGMYGGFIDRANDVAKGGLPAALGISGPNDPSIHGWVVEWGDDVVGMVLYSKTSSGRARNNTGKERVEVKAFTVKFIYRGQGLGTELLGRVLDSELKFEGGRKVEVVFAEDNVNAYDFVPAWLRGGLDIQRERVKSRLRRMEQRRTAEWEGKDRGKKKE